MLFKNATQVIRDLTHLTTFPCPDNLALATKNRLPQEILNEICLLAGGAIHLPVITDLGHWHSYELGSCASGPAASLRNLQARVRSSIRLLSRIPNRASFVRGTALLSAYAKASTYFKSEAERVRFDCKDAEWEAILPRIMRDFCADAGERKLVVRREHWGRINAYTPHHLYKMDAYTSNAKTWKMLSFLPVLVLRLAPEAEKPELIRKLVHTSLHVHTHEVHAQDQLGRIAEYEYEAFRVYLRNLTRKRRRDTTAERKLVRRILTPKIITASLLKLCKKTGSFRNSVEMSVIGDRYRLNPISKAKFPREMLESMFAASRYQGMPTRLLQEVHRFLSTITGSKVRVSRVNFSYLSPGAFEIAKELCGPPEPFTASETQSMIRSNSKLFAYLIQSEQQALLDVEFGDCHELINDALTRAMHGALNRDRLESRRAACVRRARVLSKYYTSLCARELSYHATELRIKHG